MVVASSIVALTHCSLLSCVRFNAFLAFELSSRLLNVFRSIDFGFSIKRHLG
jgi:hypothetical protein